MKITEYGPVKAGGNVKKPGQSSGTSSFSQLLSLSDSESAAPVGQMSDVAATSMPNLLALQEVSEEEQRRKKLAEKGEDLLDSLETLRLQILVGAVPPNVLRQLSHQLAMEKQQVNDPKLMALIDDIELRAAVELAKLEMAAAAVSVPPDEF